MLLDQAFKPDQLITPWNGEEINKELPADLRDFFEVFDAQPEFTVTVQTFNNETYQGRPSIIGEFKDEIPNYERLVKLAGPRFFRYKILYTDPTSGLSKGKNIDVDLTSSNWKHVAKQGEKEKSRTMREEIKEEMDERNAMIAYGGGYGPGNNQTPKEAMQDTLDMMTPLIALIKGGGSDNGGFGMKEMMIFMMQSQQQSNAQMMNMFGMMHKSSTETTLAMLGNKNNEGDKLFSMAERMFKFQNLVSPKEEGLIDKIGNFIGKNMDIISDLLSKSPTERENDSGFKKFTGDWRTKKIKEKMENNKEFAEKLIQHMDSKLEPGVTDELLTGFLKYNRKPPAKETEAETVPAQEEEITEDDFNE